MTKTQSTKERAIPKDTEDTSLPTFPLDPSNSLYIEYRHSMNLLLLSTPGLKTASASLSIAVGSLSDPDAFPGLAHFLEHMVFINSEKYPEIDGFMKFVGSNAGYCNAFTDVDRTVFYFSVSVGALGESLDMFAQFFRNPVSFDPSFVEREVNAVHSEFVNSKSEDCWLINHMLAREIKEKNGMSRFMIGNLETLNKEGVLESLRGMHSEYYREPNMCLVVNSGLGIEEMREMVENCFEHFLNKGDSNVNNIKEKEKEESGESSSLFFKLSSLYLHKLTDQKIDKIDEGKICTQNNLLNYENYEIVKFKLVSGKEVLNIFWSLNEKISSVLENTFLVIKRFFLIESPGSLNNILNNEGLVTSINFYPINSTENFDLVNLSISLSREGLKRVDDVISCVFNWIGVLSMTEPESLLRFYKETKLINDQKFALEEPRNDIERTLSIVNNMTDFTRISKNKLKSHLPYKELLLTGDYSIKKIDLSLLKKAISELLDIRRLKIFIHSSTFEDLPEHSGALYSIHYKRDSVQITHSKHQLASQLRFPPENHYLSSKPTPSSKQSPVGHQPLIFPVPPSQSSHLSFYLTDTHFTVPKNYLHLAFLSNEHSLDLSTYLRTLLMVKLLEEKLTELLWDAEELNNTVEILLGEKGVEIHIEGLDTFLEKFTEEVFLIITGFNIKAPGEGPGNFERKDSKFGISRKTVLKSYFALLEKLKALKEKQPFKQTPEILKSVFMKGSFWFMDQFKELESSTDGSDGNKGEYGESGCTEKTSGDEEPLFVKRFIEEFEGTKSNMFSVDNDSLLFYAHGSSSIDKFKSIESSVKSSLKKTFQSNEKDLPGLLSSLSLTQRTKILKEGVFQTLSFKFSSSSPENNLAMLLLQLPPSAKSYIETADTPLTKFVLNKINNTPSCEKDYNFFLGGLFSLLFSSIFSEHFFSSLRTEKQLGYAVFLKHVSIGASEGLLYLVQSPHAEIEKISEEIFEFLLDFSEGYLNGMDSKSLEKIKESIVSKWKNPIENLEAHAKENWKELSREEFGGKVREIIFERRQRMIEVCELVSIEDVRRVWKAAVEGRRGVLFEIWKKSGEGVEEMSGFKDSVEKIVRFE